MPTLVKRSDAPLYRVFVGEDWKLFAWSLSHEQPFEINVVLHNPFTTPDAQDKVTAAVCCFGIVLKKNNWFEASQDQAMQVLAATLVPEQCCVDASCNALDSPAPKNAEQSAHCLHQIANNAHRLLQMLPRLLQMLPHLLRRLSKTQTLAVLIRRRATSLPQQNMTLTQTLCGNMLTNALHATLQRPWT